MINDFYNYTVENSKLYLILPISFISTKYIIEITDGADPDKSSCISYGARAVSNNKIIVFNVSFNNGTTVNNVPSTKGFVLTLGF